jgi:sugar lactone lactonase YvrE
LYIVGTNNRNIQQYRLVKPYNITTALYEGYTPLTAFDDTDIQKIRFRDNGRELYVLSVANNVIYEYDLKIPWDITSISSNNISDRERTNSKAFTFFNSNITNGTARNFYFKPDGKKCYILAGNTNNISRIYEYDVIVPWDVTKIVMETENELWVGTNDTDPRSFVFSSDGTRIFVLGNNKDSVYAYTLSTPWSIKTALYDYKFLPVFNDEYSPTALEFSNDGTEVYFTGNVYYGINQYNLSVPFDLRTAYYPKEFFLSEESYTTEDIFFGNSGNNMYVIDRITRAVYQYSLSTAWDITTASYNNKRFDIIGLDNAPTSLHFKDDGTKVYIAGSSNIVQEVTLSTPWDINTAKLGVDYQTGNSLIETSILPDASYQGLDFKPDGTKAYAVGDTYDQIYQYSMSTPWDVSTLSYEKRSKYYGDADNWVQSGTFNRSTQGLSFNNTGTRAYTLAAQNLFQFTLSNPWEIDSLTTAKQLSVSLSSIVSETSPSSIGIATTGGKIYVIGGTTQNIFELNLSTPGDLNTASYNKKFLYAGYQEPTPTGLTFDYNGTNAYVIGNTRNTVTQYKLSSPWDVSTGVNTCKELWVDFLEQTPTTVAISTDGTKAYVCGLSSDRVYQYGLSTPWDISTGTFSGLSTSISARDSNISGLFFKPDGTTSYIIGTDNRTIYQYTLNTPWNIGSATYSGKSFSVNTQDTGSRVVTFTGTGDKFFTLGTTNNTIYQYNCSTPWDVSTGSYSGISTFVGHVETACNSLFFSSDGTKGYFSGTSRLTIFRFSMSVPWDVSTLTLDNNSFSPFVFDTAPRQCVIENGGSSLYFVGQTNRKIYQIDLDTQWDLSSTQKFGTYYLGFDDSAITDLQFNSNGTKLYITGNTNDATYQYDLATPWNVGTIVHKTQNLISIASQQTSITGVSVGESGNTMFIVGTNSNDLTHEYNLRFSYDVSSAVYSGLTIPISTQDNNTQDIAFGNGGNIMYTVGRDTNSVYQYSLGAPWNSIGSAYEGSFLSIASQENLPTSVYVSDDGRKLYVLGQNTCAVHQYSIPEATSWNISTASYENISFSIINEELIPQSITFNLGGTRMYIIGSNTRTIYQYNLGSSWDVSTAIYNGKKLFVGNNITSPVGLSFSDDGTVIYIANDGSGDNVYQFKLEVPYDITTRYGYFWSADYTSRYGSLAAVSSGIHFRDDDIQGMEISPDGTKLYLLKNTTDTIYQYNLAIPYNVNSAAYANKMLHVGPRESAPLAIKFNNEGTILYVTGSQYAVINQYDLSTAWDISTANSLVIDTGIFSNANRDMAFSSNGSELYVIADSGPTSQDNIVYQRSLLRNYDISTIENYRFYHGLTSTSMWFSSDGTQCYALQQSGNDTILQYTLTTPWDITTAWSRGLSLQVGNIGGVTENNAVGFFIGNNGTKLYTIGTSNNIVYEFTLSVRNVINTGTYTSRSFSVTSQTTASRDLKFSFDGTKMFVLSGSGNCSIFEYTLSTPWDVSTASYSSISYSVADLEYLPNAIFFSDDGSRLYVAGTSNDSIYEYSLSTPWSLSSATFTTRRKYIGGDEKIPQAIFIGNNGNRLYVNGTYTGSIYQYDLSIPWNINTTNTPFCVFTLDVLPSAVGFNTTGTKMFVTGGYEPTQSRLYEYNLSTPWKISTASYSNRSISTGINRNGLVGSYVPTAFRFKPDGTSLFLCDSSTYRVHKFDFSTPWDITTSSRNSLIVGYQDNPNSISFNNTGSRMYMIGTRFGKIFQYNLSNPWNVGTTLPLKSFPVTPNIDLNDLSFSENGRQLYVLNGTDNSISQYPLLTPWDIGSILDIRTGFGVVSQQNAARGIFFANTGFKVYIVGTTAPLRVYEYDLSIQYNISSATYAGNFIQISEDTSPQGLFFKPDGTKMYLVGTQRDRVYQYNLSTPWTITSATYENKFFSDFMEVNAPVGLFIGDNGTKLYILSLNNNYIPSGSTGILYNRLVQYTLTTPWDISSAVYVRHFTIGQVNDISGIQFNSDGTKFFVSGRGAGNGYRAVQEYSLGTAWNIGTVQISDGLFVGDRDQSINSVVFSNDGTKVYIGGRNTSTIYQYNLSTPWDVRTGTYSNNKFYHSIKQGGLSGFRFNDSGTELYLVGTGYDVAYQYQLSTPWDISTSKKKQYGLFWELGNINSIKFNGAGTKLYAASNSQNQVKQYSLSTPWNINTLDEYKKTPISYVVTEPSGIRISPNGKLMYVMDTSGTRRIFQFILQTAWDIRTAFYSNENYFVNDDNSTTDFQFADNGNKLFIVGDSNNRVYQYTLLEPWNISSAGSSETAYTISEESTPNGVGISTTGHRMYVVGTTNDTVYQYQLSTPYNLTTASYTGISTSVASIVPDPVSITFNTLGTRMYLASQANDVIYQYNLSTPWEVNTAAFSGNYLTVRYFDGSTNTRGIHLSEDGLSLFTVDQRSDYAYQYDLAIPNELTVLKDIVNVESFDNNLSGVFVKDFENTNQSSLYVLGSQRRNLIQYNFTNQSFTGIQTGIGVTGGQYGYFPMAGLTNGYEFSGISSDGQKMYLFCGGASNPNLSGITTSLSLHQFSSSTPWDISTFTPDFKSFYVGNQETSPQSAFFRPNGTNFYVIGNGTSRIYQYNMSTPWEISTASYSGNSYNVGLYYDSLPTGFSFSDDGRYVYFTGQTNVAGYTVINSTTSWDMVWQVELTTPWDLSTARSYPFGSLRSNVNNNSIVKVSFGDNGRKLYLGSNGQNNSNSRVVSTYDLIIPWNINTAQQCSGEKSLALPVTTGFSGGITFNSDGTRLFYGANGTRIYQFDLNSQRPWTFNDHNSRDNVFRPRGVGIQSFRFSKDMSRLYTLGIAYPDSITSYNSYRRSFITFKFKGLNY